MALPTRLDDAELRHAAHYQTQLSRLDREYYDGRVCDVRALIKFDMERQQITKGLQWCQRAVSFSEAVARLFVGYIIDGSQVLSIRTPPRSQLADLTRARVICRRLGDRRRESIALRHQGSALLDLGDKKRAKQRYERALSRAGEGDDAARAALFCCLGRLHANAGEIEQALTYSGRALALYEKIGDARGRSIALSNLTRAFTAAADYDKAIESGESELLITRAIKDRHGEADALGGLANAHLGRGNFETAINHYEQSICICREIGDRQGESNELYNLSVVLSKLGRQAEALTSLRAALELFEQLESPHLSDARTFLEEIQTRGGANM